MRPRVFVDSSALIAYYHERDGRHADACRVLDSLRTGARDLCSSTDVFDETVTLLRRWGGYALARYAGEELRRGGGGVALLPVRRRDREAAWELFLNNPLPALSLTDCTSAAMMKRLGVDEIVTFDSDFGALGFTTLPARPLLKPRKIRRPGLRK